MSKLTKQIIYFAMYGLLFPAGAQEVHIVEKGEIVSRIIQKYYQLPINKLYNGKLKKIIELNPHIADINLIEPGQIIYFKPKEEAPKKITRIPQSEKKMESSFDLSFDWGLEFLKYTQKTKVYTLESQIIMPSLLGFTFNGDIEDFGFRGKFNTVNFKYQDIVEGDSKWLYRFELGGNYKLLSARFEFNQEPYFTKTGPGFFDLLKQTTIWFMAGITDKKRINLKKETNYSYSLLLGIPLWSGIENNVENIQSQSGVKLDLEGQFNREVVSFKDSKLFLSLALGFYYQHQSFKTDLEPVAGKTKIDLYKTNLFISLKYGF